MATPFDPAPTPTNDPNYLGMSGGPYRSQADMSKASLFRGMGDFITSAVQGADFLMKKEIDDGLVPEVENERDDFIEGAQDAITGGSPKPRQNAPKDINNMDNRVARLNDAYTAGKITNTYYYGNLTDIVRRYKAMYPGYKDYIDQRVSSITGTTPANALRASLLQEVNEMATAGNDMVKNTLSHIRANPLAYAGFPGGVSAALSGVASGKFNAQAVLGYGLERKAEEDKVTADSNALDLKRKQKALTTEEAGTFATNLFAVRSQQAWTDATNAVGGIPAILDMMRQEREGKRSFSAMEWSAAYKQFQQLRDDTKNRMLKEANDKGLISDLGQEEVNKRIDAAMVNWQWADSALSKGSENTGLLSYVNSKAEALKQDFNLAMLAGPNGNDALTMNWLRSNLGEAAMGIYYSRNDGLNKITSFVKNATANSIATGQIPSATIALQRIKQNYKPNDPAANFSVVEVVDLLKADSKAPLAMRINVATALFGEGNKDFILQFQKQEEKQAVFVKLTSPEVRMAMEKLRDEGRPDLYEAWQQWATNDFGRLLQEEIKTTQGLVGERGITLTWDSENSRIKHNINDMGDPVRNAAVDIAWRSYKPSVDRLNIALGNLKPILEGRGDVEGDVVFRYIQQLGLDPNKPIPSIWQTLTKSLVTLANETQAELQRRQEARKQK